MDDWAVLLRPTVRRILQPLLAEAASLTRLAEHTRLSKPALQRHLKDLERIGVVARAYRSVGSTREVVYALQGCSLRLDLRPPSGEGPRAGAALSWATPGSSDPAYPLAAQVPRPEERAQVVAVLRAIERGAPKAWSTLFIVLFGSVAEGTATRKSDLDLLFVLPDDDETLQGRLSDILAGLQPEIELPIQPFFTTRSAFLAGRRRIDGAAADTGMVLHAPTHERDLWNRMTRYRTISI